MFVRIDTTEPLAMAMPCLRGRQCPVHGCAEIDARASRQELRRLLCPVTRANHVVAKLVQRLDKAVRCRSVVVPRCPQRLAVVLHAR
jgi:hypothetical protein